MKYAIVRTDKTNDQLYEIIQYIVGDSGSVEVALRYLDEVERAVTLLEDHPLIGSVPRYSILRRKGYRVLIVQRHLIFYRVNERKRVVTIHAVVDGRRAYRNLV